VTIGTVTLMYQKVLGKGTGIELDKEAEERSEILYIDALKFIEDVWLTGDGPFLTGASQPSIADLNMVCEILQTEVRASLSKL
jgi:glutathione S-transferase